MRWGKLLHSYCCTLVSISHRRMSQVSAPHCKPQCAPCQLHHCSHSRRIPNTRAGLLAERLEPIKTKPTRAGVRRPRAQIAIAHKVQQDGLHCRVCVVAAASLCAVRIWIDSRPSRAAGDACVVLVYLARGGSMDRIRKLSALCNAAGESHRMHRDNHCTQRVRVIACIERVIACGAVTLAPRSPRPTPSHTGRCQSLAPAHLDRR